MHIMSAGSPRRSHSQTRTTPGPITVSPQHVTDPTILDSVAGFINEVATYNVPCDIKDQIQWAKFEQLDCDAVLENLNGDKIIPSALILVLGYTTGVQVWAIPANGEAVELLAWRHGTVRVLRLLPSPYVVGCGSQPDIFAPKRPLMTLCDTATPGPNHCALNFLSLKTGEQVKVIKFKNPVLDVVANRRSIVVTFQERIAVFDAFTLEDRLTVTTCYLSPGIYPNPIALGSRWLAYAEKKLISNKRSSGGNEGEGVQSYTATVLHAAKTLGKGLRELGETVASSLTGNPSFKPGTSPGNNQTFGNGSSETLQKGVVTILDIENQATDDKAIDTEGVIAHFAAHSEAVVCMSFDPSGLLLLTADKRGHDFHLFRIHPHPSSPALAAVQHLYVLHRGDTTARVQDMCFSPDSRWVAVSTLRGTTHVFPITPYGGNVGVRTHATPHVVNRMSRFHRSAGLPAEGRSNSPVSLFESPVNSNLPYNNPRLPPYPHPTIVHALAQIRQPLFIQAAGAIQQRPHSGRPRLNSSSEDNIQVALRLCCCFAPPRAWFDSVPQAHDTSLTKQQAKPVESLFIMSCHGTLLQYDLDPHHISSVPKEKVCDETPIELTVQAKAQWTLQRQLHISDVPLPVSPQNLSLLPQDVPLCKSSKPSHMDDRWLSQVEIVTHAGPHRRLWMGPQFTFKTYTTSNGSIPSLNDAQAIDVGRSKPVNMPVSTTYPILIESGSVSSCEQSPKLLDTYQRLSEEVGGAGELQLKEDLADAMLESPGVRESGGRCVIVSMKPHTTSVAKVVNPLGTVVTIQSDEDNEVDVLEDAVIHENCDEALFRPVVAPKAVLFAEVKPRAVKLDGGKRRVEVSVQDNNGKDSELCEIKSKTKSKSIKVKFDFNVEQKSKISSETTKPVKTELITKPDTVPKVKLSKILKFESKIELSAKPEPPKVEPVSKFIEKVSKNVERVDVKTSEKAPDILEGISKTSIELVSLEAPVKSHKTKKVLFSLDTRKDSSSLRETKKDNLPLQETKKDILSLQETKEDNLSLQETKKDNLFPQETKKDNLSSQVIKKYNLKSSFSLNKEPDTETTFAKTLINSDLLDDTFEFPFVSTKKLSTEETDFDSIIKNDDLLKEEKFEDARDTDPLESLPVLTDKKFKSDKYQGLDPEEIVFSSEEEKTSTKKPRKPKIKLGVRLSKGKSPEKTENESLSIPKKSWSSIVSSKPDENGEQKSEDLPKMSYSTVAKQHLFEIDPHEDVCDSTSILLPEKVYEPLKSSTDYNLLKIDAKSSDDEKIGNGSSPAETTESDDSSKIIAMDTEEDGQPDMTKGTNQGMEKTVKRKSKKKKR